MTTVPSAPISNVRRAIRDSRPALRQHLSALGWRRDQPWYPCDLSRALRRDSPALLLDGLGRHRKLSPKQDRFLTKSFLQIIRVCRRRSVRAVLNASTESRRARRIAIRVAGISCHFQTDQQIDIAPEAANRRLDQAGTPVAPSKLPAPPFELMKRVSFVTRAPIDRFGGSLSKRHSFTISNLGSVSETPIGESVAMIAIGR